MDSLRALLVDVSRAALRSIDLEARVHDALPPRPPRALSASLIAIGKAAPTMAAGALARWSPYLERVVIIVPEEVPCPIEDARLELVRAAHPLPDARSLDAAERAIDLARGAQGLVLVLVSGGASSLVCAPCEGVTFDEKREAVAALLASGASISEVNTVRRHLSRIKGGGLTRAAAPVHTLAIAASDVIGGGPHDIGSGPTVPDPTTADEARAVLLRHARRFRRIPMRETLKPGDPEASLQKMRVVLSPDELARAAAEQLAARGFAVRVLDPLSRAVADMAAEYRALARVLAPGDAVVRAAEPLVSIHAPRPGRGGRSTHLATMLAHALPADIAFLAAASDGVDGASGTAGAIVDAEFCGATGEGRCREALEAFDTAPLHEEAGTALPAGPTGLNLADCHVLARRP
jgi:glycerate 2-kinase